MSEQLYTVTAKNKTGESFERKDLTQKQASGLIEDLRTWGVKDIAVVAQPCAKDLEPDIQDAHRHAVQIAVLFIVMVIVVTAMFCAAIAWAKSTDATYPKARAAFDFTPFLPK